ncbi:DNA repair protein endonuclease SAE2/CtIP C-terminus-domain-containing protein [Exophiala viscosa]|uniref:DNA repair protein endonuclease SAE2/CtIP C-terminus-domain-containing protein n=1 Tax=Exophiala viscosa TaxID=2486360 RepID=A0AAN6IGS9_9EURO|nr:DNA repair protein endonuclease SAE2/CtIP C-terminus-domain-containing protein [Exophiala viscosa]KAI1624307.1 DNA repair protein endonuclease SAE2/CtIP C-terminus-domain-containing protein [Exophiala viscosa]
MSASAQQLTSTLISALTQSELLYRQVNESIKTIERLKHENGKLKEQLDDILSKQRDAPVLPPPPDDILKRENEQLKQELEELRFHRHESKSPSEHSDEPLRLENEKLKEQLEELRGKQAAAPDLSAQFDQFFRKDVERQAEIDQLKAKLRVVQAKERKWRLQHPGVSSPVISSDETQGNTTPVDGKRKRPRSTSPQVLKEISANVVSGGNVSHNRPKFKRLSDRGAEAIPAVAEDGEEYSRERPGSAKGKDTGANESSSPHQRLQALLTAPGPTPSKLLSRPDTNAADHRLSPSTDEVEPRAPLPPTNVLPSVAPKATSVRKPPFLPPKARPAAGPEDEEPYRSRPVHRLNLSHFKINPAWNGGFDYAFEDVMRGREARKCLPGCTRPECCGAKFRALADTLPADKDMTDDELLLYFLGPDSEERIRTLTPLARLNLIHEARAKRLANQYGKMHRVAYDRAQTPPGFWSTDFPSTQEDKENREKARLMERQEIEKRYEEAKRGDGRWLFADE